MKKYSVYGSELERTGHCTAYSTPAMTAVVDRQGLPVEETAEDDRMSFEELRLTDYVFTLQENMSEEPLYAAVKDGNLDRVLTLIERPGEWN